MLHAFFDRFLQQSIIRKVISRRRSTEKERWDINNDRKKIRRAVEYEIYYHNRVSLFIDIFLLMRSWRCFFLYSFVVEITSRAAINWCIRKNRRLFAFNHWLSRLLQPKVQLGKIFLLSFHPYSKRVNWGVAVRVNQNVIDRNEQIPCILSMENTRWFLF